MSANDGVLLVFSKAPVPGMAKTRLIPLLGAEGAATLHEQLLLATLDTISCLDDLPLELWCSPDTDHPAFQHCLGSYRLDLHRQRGKDLGERMGNAFADVFERYRWAIIVGTDCPELMVADLEQTATLLRNHTDAVVGPCFDGGYYLLGLGHPAPYIFTDLPWGGSTVLEETMQRFAASGITPYMLECKHDLDRPEDLQRFCSRYR